MKDYISKLLTQAFGININNENDLEVSLLDLDLSSEQVLYIIVLSSKRFKIDIEYIYDNASIYSINELCEIMDNYINNQYQSNI